MRQTNSNAMVKAVWMWAFCAALLMCCASGKGLRRHRRGIRFQAQESRALPLDAKQQQEMKKIIYTLDADEVDPPFRPSELAFPCMSQMQFAINGKPRKPNQVTYALKSHRAPTGSLLTVEATGICEAFTGPTTIFYLRANTSDLPVFGDIFIRHAFGFLSIVMPPGSVQYIMDLGTNVGLSLLYWTTRYPDAKVIGVEPELGNFGVASLNVAHRPNVFLERAAVTDRLGLSNLKVLTEGDWGFGTESTSQLTDPKSFSSLTIPYLMNKYGWNKIDILKVDIEGAELGLCQEIARGAAWIKTVRCVTFEYHDRLFPGLATSIQDTCNNAVRKEGMTFYGHFKVDHLFLWCR